MKNPDWKKEDLSEVIDLALQIKKLNEAKKRKRVAA